jgi:glycosyltransferase involved in cell wall biosynthesis
MMGAAPLPSVSIVIVTRNCAARLSQCLKRIRCQAYPLEKIEILVVDGGSVDDTLEVATRFGAKIISGGYPDNPEARRHVGVMHSRHEIVAFIDADNMLPSADWLKDMVQPFMDDTDTIASFTKWYGYAPDTAAIDQYYALIGGNDPIAYYLGKNDRVPYGRSQLPRGAELETRRQAYDVIRFDVERMPVIGCNGYLIRRDVICGLQYPASDYFFHIDVNVDIIKHLGRNRFAIVNTSIVHLTGETIRKGLKKRIGYMQLHHVALASLRRYKVFDRSNRRDVVRLCLTVVFACTLFEPLMRALSGYIRTRNIYWWYHPLVTWLFVAGYGLGWARQAFAGSEKSIE